MARNDQVIRQWHLVRRLERSAGLTLQELADGLPDGAPKHLRTLRRDLDALESGGFPLVTDSASGQTRWKLLDGFKRLPALGFAPSELSLYLIGYCHRRQDVRMFAVERIRSLTITDHPYQLPLGFDVEAYVQDALVVMRGGRQIAVELVFDRPTAAWARDRVWHPSQQLAPLRDGRLRMTLRVADTRELVGWILSFGRGVKVVRPAELRDRVRAEAQAVARH